MARHSKIQLQILRLYREFLRTGKERPGVQEYVKAEFRKNAVIPRTDILRIEHLLRRAERQLTLLQKPTVKGMGTFEKDNSD